MKELDGDSNDPMYSAFLRGDLDDNFDDDWSDVTLGVADLKAA